MKERRSIRNTTLLLLLIVCCITIAKTDDDVPESKAIENSTSSIYFHCYGGTHDPYATIESIHIKFDCIDPTTMNVVFFPDWYNVPSKNDSIVYKVFDGLLNSGYNPIIVNYENVFKPPDDVRNSSDFQGLVKSAKAKIPFLVSRLTDLLESPFHVYSLNNIRFVGFGLGAQIISRWSRSTQTRPLRVTALDPVGKGVSTKDGLFVDVLHTGKGLFGIEAETIGHVDVRANVESDIQPACIMSDDPLCSHEMAIEYFLESIANATSFPLCENGFDYLLDRCVVKETMAYMGFHITDQASGNFYFSTNSKPPYSRGDKGLGTFTNSGLVGFDCYNGNGSQPTSFAFKEILATPFETPSKMDACNPNNNKSTVFYFPDWINVPPSQGDPTVKQLVEVLHKRDVVPIVLNYDSLLKVVVKENRNIVNLLPALEVLTAFSLYSFNMTNTRFVGYGVGVEIITNAAKVINKVSKGNVTLSHITALNPYTLATESMKTLNLKKAAKFVDAIHTGSLGYDNPVGHADFYPNFPSVNQQPNCPARDSLCGHKRAIELYIESVENPKNFPACNDGLQFLLNACKVSNNINEIIYMGFDVSMKAAGVYFLKTSPRKTAFNLGRNGINAGTDVKINPMDIPEFVYENEKDLSFQVYKYSLNTFELLLFKDLLPLSEPSKFAQHLEHTKVLAFYFPDWTELPSKHDENINDVVKALLSRPDVTPIVVNYEKMVNKLARSQDLDRIVSKLEYMLALSVINLQAMDKVRFIGFGVGAQIISGVAKKYRTLTKRQLNRITALDPLSELIGPKNSTRYLITKSDAKFVDVIHTTITSKGVKSFGHVDFYPNYPETHQPGCKSGNAALDRVCNHQRSIDFFIESLKNLKSYPTCRKSIIGLDNPCSGRDIIIYMGYDLDPQSSGGVYYLKTRPNAPYGQQGIIQNNSTFIVEASLADETESVLNLSEEELEQLGFHCHRNVKNPAKRYFISFKDILTKNFTANFTKCTGNAKRTVVYFPDWNSSENGPSISAITQAFLQKRVPILVVNYQKLLKNTRSISMPCNISAALIPDVRIYGDAINLVDEVAEISARVLKRLDSFKIRLSRGRFLGFGIGAQILSVMSSRFNEITNKKLRRITAFDPAGPGFHINPFNKNYTEFVDVIHTNMKLYGYPEPVGHVDFYVNYPNTFQPGCFESANIYERDICVERFAMCSHQRAWQFYVESLTNPRGFPGCKEKLPYLLDTCKVNAKSRPQQLVYMGFNLNTTTTGVYYLRPNANPPYGIGIKGMGAKKEAYSDLRTAGIVID